MPPLKAAALLLGLLVMLPACSRTNDYRYKVVVEVDDNGILRSGASVARVKAREGVKALASMDMGTLKVDHEAVVVPMGGGRLLVAVRGNPILSLCGSRSAYWECQRRLDTSAPTDPMEIAEPDRPILVTFSDPAGPSGVQIVSPGDLEATFGKGVRLRRMTVEVTKEPVTRTIEKYMPWACGPIDALWVGTTAPTALTGRPLIGADFCGRLN